MSLLRRFSPLLIALALFVGILVTATGSLLIARKVIAFLILPAGAIWLLFFALIFWPGIMKGPRVVFLLIWILYSFAGSPYAGVALLRTLEAPYYEYEELAEDLDALVLLGGGTIRSPGGHPALGTHGDRVLRPAMWFHAGKVKTLITTGRSITEDGPDRLLSAETSELWQSLGVPELSIIEVSEPRNTAEEMKAVSELVEKHPEWQRIGLCSSASHLNRALKEAREQGLNLIPVPSDFRSTPLIFSPMYLIPQGRGFRDVQTALWEWLGVLL